MNKTTAWDLASVRPMARRIAEDAARRAGVSLDEWLDEAIVERAVGAKPQEVTAEVNSPYGQRSISRREPGARRALRSALAIEEVVREAPESVDSAVARFEEQMARGEERTARVFETIAHILDRTDRSLDRWTPPVAPEQSGSVERSNTRPAAQPLETSDADVETGPQQPATGRRNLDERMEEIVRRLAQSQAAPDELRASKDKVAERLRFNLSDAVSQIALRRRQLDDRETSSASLSTDNGRSGWHDLRGTPGDRIRPAANPFDEAPDAPPGASPKQPESQPEDTFGLAPEFDKGRGEQRVNAAGLSALREEIATMMRAIGALAPRNAVVALEGAVRDLTDRVALLRQDGQCESLLSPLESMAAELRAALKLHDPRAIAAGLETEIRTLRGKIDALADAAIDPETFEHVRLQTEEVRNLLVAAAVRTPSIERLERQICELADRVEQLGASRTPYIDSAHMAASLAEIRREIERSTPLSALVSIERRLEQIAAQLERGVTRPAQDGIDQRLFEDLGRRIDDVRQSLDARPQPQIDSSRLEASLREINAKLATQNAETFPALMRKINDEIDASSAKAQEANAIEPMLTAIMQKLDGLAGREAVFDTRSIEHALQSLQAKLDLWEERAFDGQSVAQIAEELSHHLQNGSAQHMEAQRLADGIASLRGPLETLSAQFGNADSLASVARDLLSRLQEAGPLLKAGGAVPSSEDPASFTEEFEELRAEQAKSDIRIQAGFAEIQDLLRRLFSQLSNVENLAPSGHEEQQSTNRAKPASASFRGKASVAGPSLGSSSSLQAFDSVRDPREVEGDFLREFGIDDFLLEPGAGSPLRTGDMGELAKAIVPKTNPSVSAHIAAARRAAQSVPPEGGPANASVARPPAPRGVARAKSIYAHHKRSVLLAFAFAIVVTVAVSLIGAHAPVVRKSQLDREPANAAPTGAPQSKRAGTAFTNGPAILPVDTTPTASIAPAAEPAKTNKASGAPPAELPLTVPVGVPPPLRDAVLAGAPGAEFELAQRLFEGRGLAQDRQAAAFWFERAASSGLAPAQFRIGALYQKGVGVARDVTAAKRWYVKAAEAGNARAAHNLAVMCAEPVGEKPDYPEAAKWFRKAAEMGVRDSQFNLAVLYARGLGVSQDLGQAWVWFSVAAAQGDVDAGKKRDDVAANLDPVALAAAAHELAKLKVAKPDPVANEVAAPPGGWDEKPDASRLDSLARKP